MTTLDKTRMSQALARGIQFTAGMNVATHELQVIQDLESLHDSVVRIQEQISRMILLRSFTGKQPTDNELVLTEILISRTQALAAYQQALFETAAIREEHGISA